MQFKRVEDLSTSEIEAALKNPNITTLKGLCVELDIAKKMHNKELKERITKEDLQVSEKLHKSIFGVGAKPWTYPRSFYQRNEPIPNTCPDCGFVAKTPKQIQLHHTKNDPSFDPNQQADIIPREVKTGSLKKEPDYYTTFPLGNPIGEEFKTYLC